MFADARIRQNVSSDLHTTDKVLADLRKACASAGSQIAWCEANEFSPAYVSDVLNGKRDLGGRVLGALGFERVVLYRKVRR